MNFEDEEEWDLELLDKLVQSEEQAIAARREASATPLPCSFSPAHPPPLSHTLRRGAPPPPSKQDDHQSATFDLKQRLVQAEQELIDLRQKAQQNTTSTIGEELRRLQAEILFKDQEIIEAKRANTAKSEQLKRVSTENEELRKQFEEVKRAKWQEDTNLEAREMGGKECAPTTIKVSYTDVFDSQGAPNQDLWYPPWTPTVPLREGSKSKNSSTQDVQARSKILSREDPTSVRELKTRVLQNDSLAGCTSSKEGEIKTSSNQPQQVKTLQIPTSCTCSQDKEEIIRETENDKGLEHLFLTNLLNIWCPRNMKQESKGLVSKILAVCEVDMQILLSINSGGADFSKDLRDGRSSMASSLRYVKGKVSKDKVEGSSVTSKKNSFPSILVKVANGLLSSWSLFLAVLELSEVETAEVSDSALRILHCMLIQDEGCHKHLFGRKILPPQPEKELLKAAGNQCFPGKSDFRSFTGLNGDSSPANIFKRYFFSPRISWHNKDFPQCQHNGQGAAPSKENILPQINKERYEEIIDECVSFEGCDQAAIMGRIFKGALGKAVKGSSEAIVVTALSILVTLAANTDAFSAREKFGFVLFDGSVARLLRISASLDVRLQAVRLLHNLLHCPSVLKKLLDFQEHYNQELAAPTAKQSKELMQELELDGRSAEEIVFLQNGEDVSVQSETTRASCSTEDKGRFEVLEGLVSCLLHAGFCSQACSLRRIALRVLTFIATSCQKGAAFLLAKEVSLVKAVGANRVGDASKENKPPAFMSAGSLPVHLVALLDQELKMEEGDGCGFVTTEQTEEREYVLCETLTLLCRLASHSIQSSKTVAILTSDKNIARRSISVINRLMSRDAPSATPKLQEGKSMASSVNVIELCRGLRRRILASISTM